MDTLDNTLLGNLFTAATDVEVTEERDSVGGSFVWETGIYAGIIKTMYLDQFAGGSHYMNFVIELQDGKGRTMTHNHKETIRTVKTGGSFYIKDGKKFQLPGIKIVDNALKLFTGKDMGAILSSGEIQPRVHELYDTATQKKINQERPTVLTMTNIPCYIAFQKVLENKTELHGEVRVPVAEVRESNTVVKFMNADRRTYTEVVDNTPATFYDKWLSENEGKSRDKTRKDLPQSTGTSASGIPSANSSVDLKLG